MTRSCAGPAAPGRGPSFAVPPGSCDCHVHVLGPYDRYPLAAERSYTPPACPVEDLLALWASLGIERGVVVTPSASGFDNRVVLDALRAHPDRLRGVVLLAPDATDAVLDAMTDAGVRGMRLNLFRRDGKPVYRGGAGLDALDALGPRLAERGWHVQVWIEAGDLVEVAPRLAKLPMPVVIDHMGRMSADKGTDYPGFRLLCEGLKEGRFWTKISGADRLSVAGPPFRDVDPLARALIEANPDRVVWGSDWPHVAYFDKPVPADADMLDLLARWAPDAGIRHKILVDNPDRLYWA